MSHFNWQYDHCIHRWLVLTPAGCLITHAESPLEVVTCLLDLVITHKKIWALKILHRDISINNAMMYEEALPDGTIRVWGLLIDFDYTVKVDGSSRTAEPADCTGTLPFMAIELLQAGEDSSIQHTAAHDVKSFVYLLCWITSLYDGPQSQFRTDSKKLALESWYDDCDLCVLALNKEGCMSSHLHLHDITKHYSTLHPCITALSDLITEQLHAQCDACSPPAATVDFITGTK
ncbi:hypothetical protein F5141DRAFT_1005292 [Pisolithus sp. B1]|nr:hypothetical protein F5141DRAFT_1005292 [Pisolithus sp. B1]